MKKHIKKLLALVLALAMTLALAACGEKDPGASGNPGNSSNPGTSGTPSGGNDDPRKQGNASQGATGDTIKIGSTYCYSGAWAFIGMPVVDGARCVFDRINAQGGIGGKKIEFIHYDDGFDAANGAAFVEKLAEEDKVFALVCEAGNIVNPSLDYLKGIGIPVVNITASYKSLYAENDPTCAIFPVQPAGLVEGRNLLARLVNEPLFGPNKNEKLGSDVKIGVFAGSDEGSLFYLEAIEGYAAEYGILDRLMIETVTADTYATAVQKMIAAGCGAVINVLTDSKGVTAAMHDAGWEVPVMSTYATGTVVSYSPETYSPNRPIYCTGWSDNTGDIGDIMKADMADALSYSTQLDDATRKSYEDNGYAYAGYFSAMTLAIGLQRIADQGLDFTWDNYIYCMEQEPISITAMGLIDYSNGQRLGVTSMSLAEYVVEDVGGVPTGVMKQIRGFESVEEINAK